ncbi:Hypothetical predicted protein [Paramuricea clavata]|uniref:Uncharacterized protein n=1 Tax=Paramuricea clavata TaxID=317549 RepID=A0A7D9I9X0_PARCT|nr:Hypothetical predicted protein [Paramuricea clavata]
MKYEEEAEYQRSSHCPTRTDKRACVLAADLEEFKRKYNTTEQLDIDNVGYLHQETTYVKRMSKETKSPSRRKRCRLSMCDRQSSDSVESKVTINNVGEFSVKRNTVSREMDIDYSNESSSDGSGSSGSSYSEDMNVERDVNMIQPYAFEPVETDWSGDHEDSEEMASESSSSSDKTTRLQDTNW